MSNRKTLFTMAAALIVAAVPAAAGPITQTFNFIGTCATGCTGTVTATLKLVDTYNPRTDFVTGDFVSFNFSSNLSPSLNIFPVGVIFYGQLPASLPGGAFLGFSGADALTAFNTLLNGNWNIGSAGGIGPLTPASTGTGGVWSTATPEPASLTMLGLGLAAVTVGGRRRLFVNHKK